MVEPGSCPVVFPALDTGEVPSWNGEAFRIGDQVVRVADYGSVGVGWEEEFTSLHELEFGGDHYIDKASRRYALDVVRRRLAEKKSPTILEIGCSSGAFLEELRVLRPDAFIVGSDIVLPLLERVAERLPGVPLLRFDLNECPLLDPGFDAVVMANVLEHIEDDEQALRQVFRILKPGGILILEVPAGPGLFDIHDRYFQHFRRYDSAGLARLMETAGLEILGRSHLGFFLFPAFWALKKWNRRLLAADEATQEKHVLRALRGSGGKNVLMDAIMRLEQCFRSRVSLPFGIRCLMTARRPEAGE